MFSTDSPILEWSDGFVAHHLLLAFGEQLERRQPITMPTLVPLLQIGAASPLPSLSSPLFLLLPCLLS